MLTRIQRLVLLIGLGCLLGMGAALVRSSELPGSTLLGMTATPGGSGLTPLPTPHPARLVREGLVGRATILDPLYVGNAAERDISALLSCGLTRLGPDGSIVPDLATGWDVSPDGRSYTFRLRRDAHWHDGERVTADDVVFTVLAIQHPEYSGPYRGAWQRVIVDRVDRWTVAFHLASPIAGFLPLTTQPLDPEHVLGPLAPAARPTMPAASRPVGCGPFRLGTARTGGFELVPFDRDSGTIDAPSPSPPDPLGAQDPVPEPTPRSVDADVPSVAGMRISLFDDEAALAAAFAAGRIDNAAGLSRPATDRLAALPGVRRVRYPTTTLQALLPNLRFDHPTFQDPRVRRALLLAVDRASIVHEVLGPEASVAQAPIAPGSFAFDPVAAGSVPYDPNAAALALREAGWVQGPTGWIRPGSDSPQPLRLLTIRGAERPDLARIAEGVAAAWSRIGLNVRLEALPAWDVAARIRAGSFDIALLDLDLGLDPDLFPLLASSQAQAGGTNLSGYQSAQTDLALVDARRYADPATRRIRFGSLLRRLAVELPILPITFLEADYLVRDGLDGPAPRLVRSASDRWWNVLTWRFVGTAAP